MKKLLLAILAIAIVVPELPAASEDRFGSDPCDFVTPSTNVWLAIVMKMRARSRYGGIRLAVYEDGEHFLLVPRASVADYQKGRDFVTIREIIAPSEERDKRLREMSLSEFAALHKDTVVLLPPDKASFPVPGKLNIRIDSYNLPIERPLK